MWDERSQAQVIEVQRFRPYAKQSAVQLLEEMMRVRQVRSLSGVEAGHNSVMIKLDYHLAPLCCSAARPPVSSLISVLSSAAE